MELTKGRESRLTYDGDTLVDLDAVTKGSAHGTYCK